MNVGIYKYGSPTSSVDPYGMYGFSLKANSVVHVKYGKCVDSRGAGMKGWL